MSLDRFIIGRMFRFAIPPLVWVGAVFGVVAQSRADDPAVALENALMKLIEQSEPSVVSIAKIRHAPAETKIIPRGVLEREQPNGPPDDAENPDFQPNGYGVGVLLAGLRPNERIVLTNYHVVHDRQRSADNVADEPRLFVRFADRRACDASILAADPRSDLAVLSLDLEKSKIQAADLKPFDWTVSSPIRKGQLVVMLGNPYALAHDGSASASWGMISNLARRPLPWTKDDTSNAMMYRLGNLIQIDGRLNLGTSGGPVLNLKGELIGLTTSLAAIEGYEKSAGFAIPLDDLTRRIVKSLIAGHEVEYGMLGIKPGNVSPTEFRNLNIGIKQASAARIVIVTPDSPAQRAGLIGGEEVGDVILSVGSIPIYSSYDLMRVVGLHPPESQVEISAWNATRGKFTVKATLAKWPVLDDEGIIETIPRYPPWRGISVDYPTGRSKHHQYFEPFRRAVLVTKVASASTAQSAGIQPGTFISEVNRTPVQTPREFAEAIKKARGPVELRLYDGNRVTIGE